MGSVLMLLSIFAFVICTVMPTPFMEKQSYLSESGFITAAVNPIPGGSNFRLCPESNPDTDLFTIERVYWDPVPPRVSREQKLYVCGVFSSSVPWDAAATLDVHIPEWHHPHSPAQNLTATGDFCNVCSHVYQTDSERGIHEACDEDEDGGNVGPTAGSAVIVFEDFLFWPLPEGQWYAKMDVMMPDQDGVSGGRVFCLEGREIIFPDF